MIVVKMPRDANERNGFVDLYLSSSVLFYMHDGRAAALNASDTARLDYGTKDVKLRNASELNAWIDESGQWVDKSLLPQVSRILSISFNASAELEPGRRYRAKDNFEEMDGAFEFFAGDFIIAADKSIKLLKFISKPEVDLLMDERQTSVAPSLLHDLSIDTVVLLTSLFGDGTSRPTQHWRKVARRPALPHV